MVKPHKFLVLVDDLGHLVQVRIRMVEIDEIDETEVADDGWPKVIENVITMGNVKEHPTALSRSRNIIHYALAVSKISDIVKITVHSQLNIYFLFHRK